MSKSATVAISYKEALAKLKQGNEAYLSAQASSSDVSPKLRNETCINGQKPYAVIVTCADSRVVPEHIFSAGIGELFVIRVAGNVIDDVVLGSIEYAADHLGTPLAVVMGHTHCGAVGAAISGEGVGNIKSITDEIRLAIGTETDYDSACIKNAQYGVDKVASKLPRQILNKVKVMGALYHIDSGKVEFI